MADNEIHPSAVVEPGARLGSGVRIGPYSIVGRDVELGDGVELVSHAVVAGRTTIGARTRIFPFASIGHQPQDLKFKGEPSTLAIGADCIIREGVTMNPGTEGGGLVTIVGDRCAFLANSHVGHDCTVGNDVIFATSATLGGHCEIGDFVFIGGLSAVHQFTRIGPQAMVGGVCGVRGPRGACERQPRDTQRPAQERSRQHRAGRASPHSPAPSQSRRPTGAHRTPPVHGVAGSQKALAESVTKC